MRSMVEGACSDELIIMRFFDGAAEAPSTTLRSLGELRAVPLPRFAGGG